MVSPMAIRAPVIGVPIYHTWLGHDHRRWRHDDRGSLHDHRRLGHHHRCRLHDHWRGVNHFWKRYPHPNRDMDPACLGWEREGQTGHPDQRDHTQRPYERADAFHWVVLLL